MFKKNYKYFQSVAIILMLIVGLQLGSCKIVKADDHLDDASVAALLKSNVGAFISLPEDISYDDTKVTIAASAVLNYSIDLTWGFSGSGNPEELFTALPAGKFLMQFSPYRAPVKAHQKNLSQLPLAMFYNELHKVLVAKNRGKGLVHHGVLSPLQVFVIKLVLLVHDYERYSLEYLRKEICRLLFRLSLSAKMPNLPSIEEYIPAQVLKTVQKIAPGCDVMLRQLWNDLSQSSYDVVNSPADFVDSRILYAFVFYDQAIAATVYEEFAGCQDASVIEDISTWLTQKNYSIQAYDEVSALLNTTFSVYPDLWNGRAEHLKALQSQHDAYVKQTVGIKEIQWQDLDKKDHDALVRKAQNKECVLYLSHRTDGSSWVICCPSDLSVMGTMRATVRMMLDVFKRYVAHAQKYKKGQQLNDKQNKALKAFLELPFGKESAARLSQAYSVIPLLDDAIANKKTLKIRMEQELADLHAAQKNYPQVCATPLIKAINDHEQSIVTLNDDILFLQICAQSVQQDDIQDYQEQLKTLLHLAKENGDDEEQLSNCIQEMKEKIISLHDPYSDILSSGQQALVALENRIAVYQQEIKVIEQQYQNLEKEAERCFDPALKKSKKLICISHKPKYDAYSDHLRAQIVQYEKNCAVIRSYGVAYREYNQGYGDKELLAKLRDDTRAVIAHCDGAMTHRLQTFLDDAGLNQFMMHMTTNDEEYYEPIRQHMRLVSSWIISHSRHVKTNLVLYRYVLDLFFPELVSFFDAALSESSFSS